MGRDIVCHICGKDAHQAGRLIRISPIVGDGVWGCEKHYNRIRCVVPFCRRTFKRIGYEHVICGKHWRLAPEYMRKIVARARRQGDRLGWPDQMENRHDRLWWRTVRAAIEAATRG